MAEGYRFREIRKTECAEVLTFALATGLQADAKRLKHHLSLVAQDEDGELFAAALCLVDGDGRLILEIVTMPGSTDDALTQEMTNRCLRKIQSQTVGAIRLHSTTSKAQAETIVERAGWLDNVSEVPPPDNGRGVPSAQSTPSDPDINVESDVESDVEAQAETEEEAASVPAST